MNYIEISGEEVQYAELANEKAIEFAAAVGASDFCTLLSLKKSEAGNEVVIFETEVEVGQYPLNDIRGREIIGVEFDAEDNFIPKVYTLRKDFPQLSHQYLEKQEIPRSLCLYEMSYEEVKIFWTGFIFLERIREWLKLSANGELHQDDQPLEPLLTNYQGVLLVPPNLKQGEQLFLYSLNQDYYGRVNVYASRENLQGTPFNATFEILCGKPQIHGVIRKTPSNLSDLSDFLTAAGIDFKKELVDRLQEYKREGKDMRKILLFYIILTKKRTIDSQEVFYEAAVFVTRDTIEDLGIKLGLWAKSEQILGIILNPVTDYSSLEKCQVDMFSPITDYNREMAKRLNNVITKDEPSVVQVGVGALGSQFFMNLIRSGIGNWVIIDNDAFYPHNQARHVLHREDLMGNKVFQIANKANQLLNEPTAVKPILADIIRDKQNDGIIESIKNAEYVIDFTASPAALKTICDYETDARLLSFFTNPTGHDIVMLCEDREKSISMRDLEIQYFRGIMNTEALWDHFNDSKERVRYSNGCRDLSNTVSQDSMALNAGIASKAFKQVITDGEAKIDLWRTFEDSIQVKKYEFPRFKTQCHQVWDWKITLDKYIVDKIYEEREKKLPNETGGVLIGNYDISRKRIYIADIIMSPEDSYEYPTAYIRGIKDIDKKLNHVKQVTAGTLQYIGEWHTHPKGYGSQPSSDDLILLKWLYENMYKEGLPALMLIAGSNFDYSVYLAEQYENIT